MTWEEFEKHKPFAGEKKPSMLRRRVGHDYESRRVYLITMTVEGRRPLLGRLVGDANAPDGSPEAPRIALSPLGEQVRRCWLAIQEHYPEVMVLDITVMPDHLHGILFVKKQMEQHLGMVIKGFKAGCNKAYRQLFPPLSMLQHCCSKGDGDNGRGRGDNGKDNGRGRGDDGGNNGRGGGDDGKDNGRTHGYLWARNYNDHILEGPGELQRWHQYLTDNPRRLAVRRAHPDFFRVTFGITIAGQTYAAIGNRFLLDYPERQQVQCSRSLTNEQIATTVEQMVAKARRGVLLVSPAISQGEQAVMRAVLDARLPLIFLTPWGFNTFSKPGHQYFEACSEGRFLILAPWPHENQRFPLTRTMCLALNAMTAAICRQE